MSFNRHNDSMIFRCDVCDARRDASAGSNWDEHRLAFALAKEDGWRLERQRGKWVALCPDCASVHGYSLRPQAG